ncbi:hypothetical protein CUTER_08635 [Corynebacterium uterequi]|uniref:Uncharacterized protein n=1 Tax=Corynebacterium uterequi TaxID=1072256 RepID=A0A0G3HEJ5_9CORY|nr:hypothetical protein CUTER_08635 [Corynebacterium uterequi]
MGRPLPGANIAGLQTGKRPLSWETCQDLLAVMCQDWGGQRMRVINPWLEKEHHPGGSFNPASLAAVRDTRRVAATLRDAWTGSNLVCPRAS